MRPSEVRRGDRTLLALIAVTGVALLVRLLWLGDRIAHWDEGRVGYEILRYMATGAWEYRPIVHGPFLPHINQYVFMFGANDVTARLVVALVGGLLPLSAWLFRDHLRRTELIALGLFLAADPILVYYSRFMRNDVLVAAFAFVGLGLFIRLVDTGKRRYLYAGTAAFALSFTAKENALLYPISILGGLVLLFDHRLFLAREGEPSWISIARERIARTAGTIWRYRYHLVIAALEFLAIIVFFYAPRSGGDGFGLWQAIAQPSMLPRVIEAATVGAGDKLVSQWLTGSLSEHGYLPFLADYLDVLANASGPLGVLAVLGFIADRYRGERPRDLVSLGFYWGFVSVLGYPVAVDIRAAWSVVHAIVPLAIPAAVGVAMLYRWGRDGLAIGDNVSAGLAGVVLLLVAAQVGATVVSTSYLQPQSESNVLVQYAQPEGEMRPVLRSLRAAADEHQGLDVLWYGDHFLVENESDAHRLPLADGEWYNRLPLPWYIEASGATKNSTADPERLSRLAETERPPVIITCTNADECPDLETVRDRVNGYQEFEYEARQFSLDFVFFVDERYAP